MNLVIENVEKVSKEQIDEIMGLVQSTQTTDRPTKEEWYTWSGDHGEYEVHVLADEYEVAQVHVEVK